VRPSSKRAFNIAISLFRYCSFMDSIWYDFSFDKIWLYILHSFALSSLVYCSLVAACNSSKFKLFFMSEFTFFNYSTSNSRRLFYFSSSAILFYLIIFRSFSNDVLASVKLFSFSNRLFSSWSNFFDFCYSYCSRIVLLFSIRFFSFISLIFSR
jgi:hypothetical protein